MSKNSSWSRTKPAPTQGGGQLDRPLVDPACDAAQSLGPVVHGVHGGHDGQQHLCRTDVRGRLLTPDVLLARLESQSVGRPVLRIDRQPDQAAGQVSLEAGLHRHEGRVWTSVPQRHAETLRRPDDHVGPPLARRLQQRQRQEVGGHGDHGAPPVGVLGEGGEVADGARAPGVLLDDAEAVALGQPRGEVDHVDLYPERREACLQDCDRLREAVGVHDDSVCVDRGAPAHEGDGLRHRRPLVEQGGVGRVEARQIADHGLEVQERLEATLADLGLIGGVRRVPGRALEHVALDDAGGDRAVVAESDHRLGDHVVRGEPAQLLEHLALRGGRRKVQVPEAPHAVRNRGIHQRVEALVAEDLEHARLLVVRGPDVAAHEVLEGLELAGSCGWTLFAHGGLLACPRVTRNSLDVLPALSSDLRVSPHGCDFHLRCGRTERRFPELPRRSGMSA